MDQIKKDLRLICRIMYFENGVEKTRNNIAFMKLFGMSDETIKIMKNEIRMIDDTIAEVEGKDILSKWYNTKRKKNDEN